ncbi:MAG: hypothetical protein PWQ55_2541 [Chloroflexota bacterium]|nr:hypothetical protein [Chloroflexota bacterium]
MPRFAQIAVNVPGVQDRFDYRVPESLGDALQAGWLVEVPFGSQTVQGIILRIKDSSDVPATRPIESVLEDAPVVTAQQIALAEWLSAQYFYPLSAYLFAMLPPGLGQRADTLFELAAVTPQDDQPLTPLQRRILDQLRERGPLRGRQLETAFRHVDWRASARSLVRRGHLTSQAVLPAPAVSSKHIRAVHALLGPQELDAHLDELGRAGSAAAERRLAALRVLAEAGQEMDVSWVYASSGATSADLRYLEKHNLVTFGQQQVWRDPLADKEPAADVVPQLTADQARAWETLAGLLRSKAHAKPALLQGVTGSGKTELYLRAIEACLQAGKQAIVLVPEISMTPQTIDRFMARFPGRVGAVHSKLSPGERYDTWQRARQADFSIVVGPRSALFTPFPDVGVIVVDECHDDSFYQTDMGPYYHAVRAAAELGRLCNAQVIFGSATPTVTMAFRARHEQWPVLELPRRVLAHRASTGQEAARDVSVDSLPLPEVDVVDMRVELQQGNTSIFSRAMQQELGRVLEAKQQAILLLNRRGSASYVFCRDCGESLRCPRCDFPLTYHRSSAGLVCHTCGYTRKMPKTCPNCGSRKIKQFGLGTEKVEDELQRAYPSARVLRWDADTARGKNSQEIILSHFRQHNADFLIGTQMLAKGLDLPLVTLVGVVLADVGLNFPDYRTAERAFQLLTQVAGRAGRSALGGRVLVQTFQPENDAIRFAAQHDFAGFYAYELEQRRRLGYPPFVRMVRLEARDRDNDAAHAQAQGLAQRLRALMQRSPDRTLSLSGPLPPYFARQNGQYRWQLILKGGRPESLLQGQDLSGFIVEVDPPSLL